MIKTEKLTLIEKQLPFFLQLIEILFIIMNSNTCQPKNETDELLLSITKNTDSLIKRRQTKPQKILDFKMKKPTETISFDNSLNLEDEWMLGVKCFEVYISIFNVIKKQFKVTKLEEDFFNWGKIVFLDEKEQNSYFVCEEGIKDEILTPIILDGLKSIKYNEEDFMRNMMKLTDEEISFVLDHYTVYENLLQDYIKSVFQDLKVVLEQFKKKNWNIF